MSWKVAITVALLTALITAIIAIVVATNVAERYGVSDREGARSMSIFFFLAPAAFVVGLLLGLLGSYYSGASEWAQFWQATGTSVGMAMLAILSIAGYYLISAPTTSTTGVSPFIVQMEFYIPLERISEHPEAHSPMLVTLNSGPAMSYAAAIDTTLTYRENGQMVVTAFADLSSNPNSAVLSLFIDENNWLELQDLALETPPSGTDPVWSDLIRMHDMLMERPYTTNVQARVRVVERDRTK